jgi:hypothetical protein
MTTRVCEKCARSVDPSESYEYAGRLLCEDCYLEQVATPKTCDPWAVYSAKKTTEKNAELTAIQQKMLDLLRDKGPLSASAICDGLGLKESEFQTNFATLRHMELARGFKEGDQVYYTLFKDGSD